MAIRKVAFYHVCMINHYADVVSEHLYLIEKHGLAEHLDMLYVNAVGNKGEYENLLNITKNYTGRIRVTYSGPADMYEFPTLEMMQDYCRNAEPCFVLYFHTKGVSYPGNEGGKYWRDYMNHYLIERWQNNIKKLQKGADMCGVKLITPPPFPLHYSGNFYWTRSSYISRCQDLRTVNHRDRFQAEFWSGTGHPRAESLCQMFVDYNTKGVFRRTDVYVHTLCWNLPSEVEKVTRKLYELNNRSEFVHYIVDLGFPLDGHSIPSDVEKAKAINTERLKDIARRYGSRYVRIPNIGVSQNWTQIAQHIGIQDGDVLIGQDPDEHPQTPNWIRAMAETIRANDKIGLVSLMMTDHVNILNAAPDRMVGGRRVIFPQAGLNWALIALNGKFLRLMGEVPYPKDNPIYGWIESAMAPHFAQHGYTWCVMRDYLVEHTDFEKGNPGTSKILRQWKNENVFHRPGRQITLEAYIASLQK